MCLRHIFTHFVIGCWRHAHISWDILSWFGLLNSYNAPSLVNEGQYLVVNYKYRNSRTTSIVPQMRDWDCWLLILNLRYYLLRFTCDYISEVFSVNIIEQTLEVTINWLIVMFVVIDTALLMFMVTPYACSGIHQ